MKAKQVASNSMPLPCSATLTDADLADTSSHTTTRAFGLAHFPRSSTETRVRHFSPSTHRTNTARLASWGLLFLRTSTAQSGSIGERATRQISAGIRFSSVLLLALTHHSQASRGAWTSAVSPVHTAPRFSSLAVSSPFAVSAAAATLSTSTSGTLRLVTYGRL